VHATPPLLAPGAVVHALPPVCAHAVMVDDDFGVGDVQVAEPVHSPIHTQPILPQPVHTQAIHTQPVHSAVHTYHAGYGGPAGVNGVGGVGGDSGRVALVEELCVGEAGRTVMMGVEWEPDASRLSKALWLLESPLSVLRWATIPTDGEWDWRRRRWAAATPPLAAMLMCVEIGGGVNGALQASAGAMPLILLLPLLCSPLPYFLWKFTRDDVAPRLHAGLVIAGFVMSIVWLDRIATEVVALIETAGFLMGIDPC
jgi:hypothetical protein